MNSASRRLVALVVSFCVLSLGALQGCTTDPYTGERKVSKTAIGALLGAASGAAIGAIADKRNRARGAAIGAGVGVLAGGAVGGYMDYQEKKLRERLQGTGVSVTRVGDDIYLNMPGNLTFDTDRAEIRGDFYEVLNSVALVLDEFDKTLIEVTGHTDSTGSDSHNQQLSERRSQAVGSYLVAQQVQRERVITHGFGEQYPIADNGTTEGRQANRRVELRLVPLTAS
jgi:outer membrane protein OmpA-like peptidoglycan-associated protein